MMPDLGSPNPKETPPGAKADGRRGSALIEFAVVLPFLLMLLMATIDFGNLIQRRLIVTNVSREGGSIASRASVIDATHTNMILASSSPLILSGGDGKVYVTRIKAGASKNSPNPTIEKQLIAGSLAVASKIAVGKPNLGLTPKMYAHLVYKTLNGTADITQVTVVEVIYKYRPITPLAGFMPGMLNSDNGGLIISSKAVF